MKQIITININRHEDSCTFTIDGTEIAHIRTPKGGNAETQLRFCYFNYRDWYEYNMQAAIKKVSEKIERHFKNRYNLGVKFV